jgi:hypothetical protein
MSPRKEPTIGELIADPLIRAVMAADHVDANALEAMLHSLAHREAKRPGTAIVVRRQPLFDHLEASPLPPSSAAAKAAREICGSICTW